jgi:hypothetical protein
MLFWALSGGSITAKIGGLIKAIIDSNQKTEFFLKKENFI